MKNIISYLLLLLVFSSIICKEDKNENLDSYFSWIKTYSDYAFQKLNETKETMGKYYSDQYSNFTGEYFSLNKTYDYYDAIQSYISETTYSLKDTIYSQINSVKTYTENSTKIMEDLEILKNKAIHNFYQTTEKIYNITADVKIKGNTYIELIENITLEGVKEKTTNFIVKESWNHILEHANNIEDLEDLINNPISFIMKFVLDKTSNNKNEIKEDSQEKSENFNSEEISKIFSSDLTGFMKSIIHKNLDKVVKGIYYEILIQFSPIGILSSQELLNNFIRVEELLNVDLGDYRKFKKDSHSFIKNMTNLCSEGKEIKETLNKLVDSLTQIFIQNFDKMKYILKYLHGEEITDFHIQDEIIEFTSVTWSIIKDSIPNLLKGTSECFVKYTEKVTDFNSQHNSKVYLQTALLFVNNLSSNVPVISQTKGIFNSLIAILNKLNFLKEINKMKNGLANKAKFLGRLMGKFLARIFKAGLALFNIEMISNFYNMLSHIWKFSNK